MLFYKSIIFMELNRIYIYTRSLGRYTALLLAPAEGWWPSATWEDPNDFLYSEWAYLGGQFSDIL